MTKWFRQRPRIAQDVLGVSTDAPGTVTAQNTLQSSAVARIFAGPLATKHPKRVELEGGAA